MGDQPIQAIRKAVAQMRDERRSVPEIFNRVREAIEAELTNPTTRPAAPARTPRWYPPVTK